MGTSESKAKDFDGELHFLTDNSATATVSKDKKTTTSTSSKSQTIASSETLNDTNTLDVTVRATRVGSRLFLGVVGADTIEGCRSHCPGEVEIDRSVGCCVEDGRVMLVHRDQIFFNGDCVTSDPFELRMSVCDGGLAFFLNGEELLADHLPQLRLSGMYRVGLGFTEESQTATVISVRSAHVESEDVAPGTMVAERTASFSRQPELPAGAIPFNELNFEMSSASLLGRGSCGSVYRGTWRGVDVALKVMSWTDDPHIRNEVQVGLGLFHPNVVQTMGWTRHANVLILVMALMDTSLDKRLHNDQPSNPACGGPLGWKEFYETCVGILRGLTYLSERTPAILHRDLKPGNILFKDGVAKLADFGLAREVSTANASVSGTPNYMSPEQLAGSSLTTATDVYSFACIAWEILFAPKRPHEDAGSSRVAPLPFDDVPGTVKIVLQPCLRPKPASRPSAQQLLETFEDLKASVSH